MSGLAARWQYRCALLALLATPVCLVEAQPGKGAVSSFPAPEVLNYQIEWRLINAGSARVVLAPASLNGKPEWQTTVRLESVGLVSRLYRVDDNYSVFFDDQFCLHNTLMSANEGRRHRESKITVDLARGKANYVERDTAKNAVLQNKEIDIPACVHDVIGALYAMRGMRVELGQSIHLPITDGKKSVLARVEVQEHEQIKTPAGTYQTTRYEAFLFDNVLYMRKGRLLVWLTDDARRTPVQIRVRLQFAIGTITLYLLKEEHPG